MPPLKTYIFKHKLSSQVTITIETYGNVDRAFKMLGNYVSNINDWFNQNKKK